MEKKSFIKDVLFDREFLAVFLIVVNALSWYFPLYVLFTDSVSGLRMDHNVILMIFGVHYAAVLGFAVIGITIVNKLVKLNTLLSFWMVLGIVATVLMSFLGEGNPIQLFLIAFVLGIALGLGFPSCLACFADYGVTEWRGRFGGFTYCVAGLGIFLIGVSTVFLTLIESLAVLTIWRVIGLIAFVTIKPQWNPTKNEVDVSYRTILGQRSFVLYLVPWLMFCLINYLERPIHANLFGTYLFYVQQIVEFGIGSFVAMIGGFFADMVGRKRVVIIGFVMLGIGYAVLGLFPGDVRVPYSWYLYIAVDGVAWGILALMFFIILWGELAENRVKGKYYLLGVLPFLLSSYLEIIATPYVVSFPSYASFSLASFFLFVAVLPLMYAPETLPQKKIELRKFKNYIEAAKKLREEAGEET